MLQQRESQPAGPGGAHGSPRARLRHVRCDRAAPIICPPRAQRRSQIRGARPWEPPLSSPPGSPAAPSSRSCTRQPSRQGRPAAPAHPFANHATPISREIHPPPISRYANFTLHIAHTQPKPPTHSRRALPCAPKLASRSRLKAGSAKHHRGTPRVRISQLSRTCCNYILRMRRMHSLQQLSGASQS